MLNVKKAAVLNNFTLNQASQVSKATFSLAYLNEEGAVLLFHPIKCREYLNEIVQQYCGYARSSDEGIHGFYAGSLKFDKEKQLYLFVGGLSAEMRDKILERFKTEIPDLDQSGVVGVVGGGFLLPLPERFYSSSFLLGLITNNIRNIERFGSTEELYRSYTITAPTNLAHGNSVTGGTGLGGAEHSFARAVIVVSKSIDSALDAYYTALRSGGPEVWGVEPDLRKMGGYEVHSRGITSSWRTAFNLNRGALTVSSNTDPASVWLRQYCL